LFLFLANFEEDVVKKAADQLKAGIYCGWASVDNGPVYKMVMFFGCAPFFKCTKMSMVCICSSCQL